MRYATGMSSRAPNITHTVLERLLDQPPAGLNHTPRQMLAASGIRHLGRAVAGGNSCLYFTLPEGQRLRVSRKLEQDSRTRRAPQPEQLQAITAMNLGNLEFEVLPAVADAATADSHAALLAHAQQRGLRLQDVSFENGDSRRLPDGTPIFVDRDAVLHGDNGQQPAQGAEAYRDFLSPIPRRDPRRSRLFPQLHALGDHEHQYISKQEQYYPALLDGRIRGMLTESDRKRLEAGELDALIAEKPECFLFVTAEVPGARDPAIRHAPGGMQHLYALAEPSQRFCITPETLPDFLHKVFDERRYPVQALESLAMLAQAREEQPTPASVVNDPTHRGVIKGEMAQEPARSPS